MMETTDGRYFRTKRGVWWDLINAEIVPVTRVMEHTDIFRNVSIRWVEERDQ